MKDVTIFILILLVFWLGHQTIKARQDIKPNGTLSQSDSIYRLKSELYVKDSLMMNIQDSFKDESYKECLRFKKIYFNN